MYLTGHPERVDEPHFTRQAVRHSYFASSDWQARTLSLQIQLKSRQLHLRKAKEIAHRIAMNPIATRNRSSFSFAVTVLLSLQLHTEVLECD